MKQHSGNVTPERAQTYKVSLERALAQLKDGKPE
jgi:hypothetical protein